jgi:tetratricopeptide (TPR) repeat protein
VTSNLANPADAPDLTRRERDVLIALCRPALEGEVFTEPASVGQIAAALVVTDAAVKQHLSHLYDKFAIAETGERRRVRLAREAIRRGAVTLGEIEAASEALRAGREAFERRSWSRAVELLTAADTSTRLGADDLDRLAEAALWADRHEESFAAHQRAYQEHLRGGRPARAAFVALMLVIHYAVRLELAAAEGWLAKAERLLDAEPEGPVHGYRALVAALFAEASGDWDAVHDSGLQMHEIGCRHDDADLQAVGLTFQGLVRARRGEVADGMRLLDEAMASATGGELAMLATGIVYCRMMGACLDLYDYRRAGEWTNLVESCRATTGMGGFPGDCRTHRATVLVMRGAWVEGEQEALRALEELQAFNLEHVGHASYELGEIRLRQGNLEAAEEAFLRAHEYGFTPQPGLALLHLARGNVGTAISSIDTALSDAHLDPLARSRLLPARVEITLAAGDTDSARSSVAELEQLATTYRIPALTAAAEHALGQLALAVGDLPAATGRLASAHRLWQQVDAPYEAARARELLGEAQLRKGERDTGALQLHAARSAFQRLGATLDRERTERRIAEIAHL